jgi:transcriptional regulator of nitric oxide reductase
MILMKSIVVIFSAKRILFVNLICWIADRLIERFEVQLRVIAVYLMIEKMKIDVWLTVTMRIVAW